MIVTYTDLTRVREEHAGQRVAFCDGVFDLLHAAHIEHIRMLRQLGDVLVLGIMSDEWVKMRKGDKRPIMSQTERLNLVDALRDVDYTILLYDEKKQERIRTSEALAQLRPDIFVTTDDSWGARAEEFEALGIELRIVQRTPSAGVLSTSALIQRILDLGKP